MRLLRRLIGAFLSNGRSAAHTSRDNALKMAESTDAIVHRVETATRVAQTTYAKAKQARQSSQKRASKAMKQMTDAMRFGNDP